MLLAAAIVVGTAGPTLRAWAMVGAGAALVVAGAGSLAVVSARTGGRGGAQLVFALGAAAAATSVASFWTGGWLLLSVLLVQWVFLGVRFNDVLPEPARVALPGTVILSLVAAYRGQEPTGGYTAVPITLVAAALALAASYRPDFARRLVDAVGHWASLVVSRVLFMLLGLFVVVIPWFVSRLAMVDPLEPRTRPASRWIGRDRLRVRASRPWTTASRQTAPSPARRLRSFGAAAAVTLLASWGLYNVLDLQPGTGPPVAAATGERPAAFADAEWWPEYQEQMNEVYFDPGTSYNPLRYPLVDDATTTYVNVENGMRRTWAPPECGCRRVVVWMYGGSTVVGLGQRDDHTIASALARLAWEDGLAVDVHNRGVLGDLHWEEVQRFAWDLEAEDRPDVVIFYSGSNDIVGTQFREEIAGELDGTPVDWTAEEPFGRRTADGDSSDERLSPSEMGSYVRDQYLRARQMGLHAAEAHTVSAYWFWQPSRYTRAPVAGEPQKDDAFEQQQRAVYRAAADGLPPGVIDLSGLFRSSSAALFYDDVHTNEPASALVAEAMYREVEADIRAASGSDVGDPGA